jgi:uncharacterized membrane protein
MSFSFPLGLQDISLWLAVSALILLATSQVLSPHYGKTNILINSRKLEKAALAVFVLFLITVVIGIID